MVEAGVPEQGDELRVGAGKEVSRHAFVILHLGAGKDAHSGERRRDGRSAGGGVNRERDGRLCPGGAREG